MFLNLVSDVMLQEGSENLIGVIIDDKYEIVDKIADGGMGSVYRAQHIRLKRPVAIKFVSKEIISSNPEEFIQRFEREATTASKIQHPHAVSIHDFGIFYGTPYLIMQFVEGVTLKGLLYEEGPLSFERTLAILTQIADALDEAHTLGIVHRDVKPENIMVSVRGPREHATLLDFGIAKVLEEDAEEAAPLEDTMARRGGLIGSPQYMSPEQLRGEEIDSRADIYSLGVIAYEMLSGEIPFEAESPMHYMVQQMSDPPRPLRSLVQSEEITEGLCDAVMKSLSKSRDERQQTAKQFVDEMRQAYLDGFAPRHGQEGIAKVEVQAPLVVTRTERTAPKKNQSPISPFLSGSLGVSILAWLLMGFLDDGTPEIRDQSASSMRARQQPVVAQAKAAGVAPVPAAATQANKEGEPEKQDSTSKLEDSNQDSQSASSKPKQVEEVPTAISKPAPKAQAETKEIPVKARSDNERTSVREAKDKVVERSSLEQEMTQAALFSEPPTEKNGVEVYEQAVNARPDDPLLRRSLAWAYAEKGRHKDAVKQLEKAVELDPENPLSLMSLGNSLAALGEHERAIAVLERAIEKEPDSVSAQANLGSSLVSLGRFDKAIPVLSRAVVLNGQSAATRFALGFAFQKTNNLERAKQEFQETLRLNSSFPKASFQLGSVVLEQGDAEQARKHFEAAIQLQPTHAQSHNNLGVALERLGRKDDARRAYEKALKLDPKNAQFKANVANLTVPQ